MTFRMDGNHYTRMRHHSKGKNTQTYHKCGESSGWDNWGRLDIKDLFNSLISVVMSGVL